MSFKGCLLRKVWSNPLDLITLFKIYDHVPLLSSLTKHMRQDMEIYRE